ncbi:MAG: TonB-dependent siderophore receptor [Nodosilinea sp.]
MEMSLQNRDNGKFWAGMLMRCSARGAAQMPFLVGLWVIAALVVIPEPVRATEDVAAPPAEAEPIALDEVPQASVATLGAVPALSELEQPATTVADWMAQIAQSVVQITGVRLETTEAGLQVVLETVAGELSAPTTRSLGNALIAEFPNAVLALPDGGEFTQASPAEGIALVTATNLAGNTVQVAITGVDAPPTIAVSAGAEGLVLSIAPGIASADADGEAIQVVVTGEQDEGYNPSRASTATRTDTPLRDIPASISVIPRQVLEDQNTIRIQDALQNVSGVNKRGNFGSTDAGGYFIRGFSQDGNFRNGFSDNDFYSSVDPANIERIEVLRGPASVLYGQVEPGGIINVVTKQPLSTPYYSAELSVGNYSFYRPSIDFSGPLNDDNSLLYRLNVAYQNAGSFRDFNFTERVFIAPVVTWNMSDRTSVTFDFEYLNNNYRFDRGLPSVGDRPAPIPISRFIGYTLEGDTYTDNAFRAGYRFEHNFSEDWKLRNAFSFVRSDSGGIAAFSGRPMIDDQFSRIFVSEDSFLRENYTLQTELLGSFTTGSVVHRPLLGVELRRNSQSYVSFDVSEPVPPIDIFNPNYNVTLPAIPSESTFSYIARRNTLGIYLQDQINLADNLKVLIGGRFDTTRYEDDFGTLESQSDTAFSPRAGIVYQPIEPISLYASYSRSFNPVIGRSRTDTTFEPERGTQYEIGIRADITERLSATLAAFEITKSNVLTTDPEDSRFSIQVGEQRSRGIELDVTGEILPGWRIITSYAYTDAIISQDNNIPVGNRIFNVPQHAASLWTTYEIQQGNLQGLGLGLGLYYVGDRFADNQNTSTMLDYFRTDSAI